MTLDRFQHQTHSPSFSPDTQECPFFVTELPALNTKPKQHVNGSSQTADLQLYHFAPNKHHLGLTSILSDTQASLPIHTGLNKCNFCGHLYHILFFSFLTLTTRRKIQKTRHLLRFWYKLSSPVERRSSWHTFLAKTIKLQPHHPKLHEESLTIPEDPSDSLSDEQQISFEWRDQSKNLFCFPPSQASRLTCAICIG